MKKISTLLLTLFLCTILTQCKNPKQDSENTTPKSEVITITDTKGNVSEFEKSPQKVVALYEPLLELIYMLDVESTLVGIPSKMYTNKDSYTYFGLIDDRIKDKTLATPGDFEVANLESIVALQPDLVLAYDLPEGIIESLRSMNINVYIGKSETYNDIQKETQDLSLIFNKEERGKQLLDFVATEFQKFKDEVKDKEQKSAYFSWANGRIFSTTGTASMMHQCLVFGGVNNVCTTEMDQANINPETLLSWNPDVIYMWNDSPELFYQHKQLVQINAIKSKSVYNLIPMFLYNPHTLKSVLTTLRIQNWAYQIRTEDEVQSLLKSYLEMLYGKEKADKLTIHL
ncbi:MAG: ABC transporter substrate-binding protein [Bacteroidota bacterium]|nr:ABC transporter substrate-binding protein [Bacteroidota bacterium]